MASGRPSKFKPKYCKIAKEFLAKGYSTKVLAGELEVNESTIYQWIKDYPIFSKHIDEGRALGEKYYIDLCKRMGEGERGNFNSVAFLLKNIYRYSDSPQSEIEDNKPININFTIAKPEDNE